MLGETNVEPESEIRKYMNDLNKRLVRLEEENKYIKKHCLHIVLIEQVRKEMRAKIISDVSKCPDYLQSHFVRLTQFPIQELYPPKPPRYWQSQQKTTEAELINQNPFLRIVFSCFPKWTLNEINLLFAAPAYNELLYVAYPKFSIDFDLNELRMACSPKYNDTENEKVNWKCYRELYANEEYDLISFESRQLLNI